MPRAEFVNAAKCFGDRPVFSGLSFKLAVGRRYALLGPNGAGKSTLLRLLTGSLAPDEGSVTVDGLPAWRNRDRLRSRVGILPEGAPLIGDLTVREHLKLAARLKGLTGNTFKEEEERLVNGLALAAFYGRPAAVLSQGQKRRAGLAAAFLGWPDFLVLDEPTSGLDPEETARLITLMKNLPPKTTTLISSHILSEIMAMTDEALILAGGGLAAFGPWEEILTGPNQTPAALTAGYLRLIGRPAGQ